MDELKARKVSNVISKYREVDHRRVTGRCNRKIEDGKLNSSPSLMLRINLEEIAAFSFPRCRWQNIS